MLRAMSTAITSLGLHQSYMDVIADNLANANTSGFKSSTVTFQDQFGQLLGAGSSPTADLGGINPTQIGLGVRLGSISRNFTQGTLKDTGRSLDMALQGDGFFIYQDGETRYYSRDGSLELDSEGVLVNASTGQRILGWMPNAAGVIDTGTGLSEISIPLDDALARATTEALLGGNIDASAGISDTMQITIGAYDSLGDLQTLSIEFEKTADNEWDWTVTSGGSGTGTLTFNSDGSYDAVTATQITITGAGGAANTVFDIDFSDLTQLSTDDTVALVSQNGLAAGTISGFDVVSNTGEIYGLYSNGLQQLLGQISIASFVNPVGLNRVGQNMYTVGLNSGEPQVGEAGTGGRGTISSGYLEASNVDLSKEFTNMILAQRGFQASSRIITTSDEMLQELVNLKR
ncbi:MAG: flagellar hook protein FlgE [Anaerolineales bacterium]|nr:flagellar hook protein FlgE [Anaerolineales bacterium]